MNTSSEPVVRRRVIIADDSAMISEKVRLLLEPAFDVVAAVSDGIELLEAVPTFLPEIGVIDISMPRMSGIEAIRHLKSHGSEMVVIFLTVNEDPDFVQAAFESGATAYVLKPRMVIDLLPAIRRALKGQTFVSPCAVFAEIAMPQYTDE